MLPISWGEITLYLIIAALGALGAAVSLAALFLYLRLA